MMYLDFLYLLIGSCISEKTDYLGVKNGIKKFWFSSLSTVKARKFMTRFKMPLIVTKFQMLMHSI